MSIAAIRTAATQTSLHTRAIGRAVDLAWKDIDKVHHRMTEELRAEDAIGGLKLVGREVHVDVDSRYEFKAAGLRKLVRDLLAKHGAPGVRVELHQKTSPLAAVTKAWESIQRIQQRLTRELRAEDGVAGLKLLPDGRVSVSLHPGQPYGEAEIRSLVKKHLADAGLKNARLDLVASTRPARTEARVAAAWDAVKQVQQRLTTDLRAEDDIVGLSYDAGLGTVRVPLRAHPHFDIAAIKAAVEKHLADQGVTGVTIDFIRPAIDPIRPPVVTPPPTSPMKAKVEAFASHIKKVQSRLTEELRIEDGVKSVKLKGAKVEVAIQRPGPFDPARVEQWVKDQLKTSGVTLPIVFV